MTRSHAGPPKVITRGRVYGAVLSERLGEKYYLAVSSNPRNRVLSSFLAIPLTTTLKSRLDTIVHLDHRDGPWCGSALADDITEVFRDEVTRELGALPLATMRRVDDALRAALAL
ncbi:type II toxin-antitoxin system PemK/MazF family toxin [Actinocrispum wychmicini]|uniref:mRNA-degrading endonuclease toxin of MazEF toxin-antitoxin module n=1 Tax=Actinocrispum wychmicini TaxID=1213861 RepID=A0A4R2JJE2_9PSEU|nr:type II toxin-antitoxin system PemK/MazF family toxin [Actinocrispum wychmicini]TCO56629.1 mRNA-degrading endonuclease toxin of MazEF toxin-antitoxin module [Actinocrispum wychmicini]